MSRAARSGEKRFGSNFRKPERSELEPVVGFEPTTDGLQNRCSTTELNWLPKAGKSSMLSPRINAEAHKFARANEGILSEPTP
jgi:hypothetical protein